MPVLRLVVTRLIPTSRSQPFFRMQNIRGLASIELTKNLKLISADSTPVQVRGFNVITPPKRPLVVMLCWLLAKQRHINKYVDYYLQNDMDVLSVTINPWQLLWPVKGAQLIAKDILRFLETNAAYRPLVLHGFSVGGYLWGEVLVHIDHEPERYQSVIDRIEGQIFDSVANITEMEMGFAAAVFPHNPVMQHGLRKYVAYHLKAFEKVATCHYFRSSHLFHNTSVRAPVLLLVSKADPVGSVRSNILLKENLERMGIKVFWKCWDQSPHVGHYRRYPQEYLAVLDNYMMHTGLLANQERMHAKL